MRMNVLTVISQICTLYPLGDNGRIESQPLLLLLLLNCKHCPSKIEQISGDDRKNGISTNFMGLFSFRILLRVMASPYNPFKWLLLLLSL